MRKREAADREILPRTLNKTLIDDATQKRAIDWLGPNRNNLAHRAANSDKFTNKFIILQHIAADETLRPMLFQKNENDFFPISLAIRVNVCLKGSSGEKNRDSCWKMLLSLPLDLAQATNHSRVLEVLVKRYYDEKNLSYQKTLVNLLTTLMPLRPCFNKISNLDLQYQFILHADLLSITADYFTQLLTQLEGWSQEAKIMPKDMTTLIGDYVHPAGFEDVLLDAGPQSPKTSLICQPLSVILQDGALGLCGSHTAFFLEFAKVLQKPDPLSMRSFFRNIFETQMHPTEIKREPLEQATHFFLQRAANMKQAGEDVTPISMQQWIKFKKSGSDATLIPYNSKKTDSLGETELSLSLTMLKNLLELHDRYHRGKPLRHAFAIYCDNNHWFAITLIAQASKNFLCLIMDSNPRDNTIVQSLCQLLEDLITNRESLIIQTQRILGQAMDEMKRELEKIKSRKDLLN